MEWIEKLNQAVAYIEEHLTGTVDYNEAAKIACCSTFHFQRMFSYIAGVTLAEYIRRRRMTMAALELQQSGIRIVELSAKYGYDSPTSFNRAFQSIHDLSPSAARRRGTVLKNYPKLSFSMAVKGDAEMEYRIEEKPEIRIIGVPNGLEFDMEKNFVTVPVFWEKVKKSKFFLQIRGLMNQSPAGILGITRYQNRTDVEYYIAVTSDKPAPDGTVEYVIPAATWVIFECTGKFPEAIQELYRRFYTEWLPFSGYQYAETHDIEVYPVSEREAQKAEIWFAVHQ